MQRFGSTQFLKLSIVYVTFGSILTATIHPRGVDFVLSMLNAPQIHFTNLLKYMPYFSGVIILLAVLSRAFLSKERMKQVLVIFSANLLFMAGFSMCKSLMPHVNPFWADPLLASIDKALHFGMHPWEILEPLRLPVGTGPIDYIYLKFWAWAGVAGPILIALFDNNQARISRFLQLYCFSWIVLGNVFAAIFMSGGPVFMDRIFGTEEFAALTVALSTEAEQTSIMGRMREWLWIVNVDGFRGISSGISAFPSLHVAIAAITFLYFLERSKYLILPGLAFLLFIQFGSVISGLHYAIDGYFSTLAIFAFWYYLRRGEARDAQLHPNDAEAQTA